jgi:hypothetical protein
MEMNTKYYKQCRKQLRPFHNYGINVFHIYRNTKGTITEEQLIDITPQAVNNHFIQWLDTNLQPSEEGETVSLRDICELYLGKAVPSRVATKIKTDIEKYIAHKYPNKDPNYKDTSINCVRFRGWNGFVLKLSS